MRAIGANAFAVFAGLAIGFLTTMVVLMRILSHDSVEAVFAALILAPILFVEVTAGAVVTLVLLANERRGAAAVAATAFALVLLGEYAWLAA